jgi:anti-anti-sigma factor
MPIEKWSDGVVVVHLADDPQFSDDVDQLDATAASNDAVIDFGAVGFVNSSNIARLLKLRKKMNSAGRRMVMCNLSTQVCGTFLITGLDKIFEFSDDVPTALASVQMAK